jgi:hypothetical protein
LIATLVALEMSSALAQQALLVHITGMPHSTRAEYLMCACATTGFSFKQPMLNGVNNQIVTALVAGEVSATLFVHARA